MRKPLQNLLPVLLPMAFLLLALMVLSLLFVTRPQATRHSVEANLPPVSVVVAQPRDLRIPVSVRGWVMPFQEQTLQAGSRGVVTYIAPNLVAGGGFRQGQLLVELSDRQLETELQFARADELKAEHTLRQTELESAGRHQAGTAGVLMAAAQQSAQLLEAAAHQHVVDLQTRQQQARIFAPFDGWVMVENVALGMQVQSGTPLARLFAESRVNIRVALLDEQLALLELPSTGSLPATPPSTARITWRDGSKRFHWQGNITGTEGRVDELTRQTLVNIRVNDPFAADPAQPQRPELHLGTLVEVELSGRLMPGLYEVPRAAIHNGSQLWIVNQRGRLERRSLTILYQGRHSIYVTQGIHPGERILLTQLSNAAEGLPVALVDLPQDQAEWTP
ncbi:efflux RND transporter periplasmic adaptor subunit [Ketobacter sp.]|uniref:efflux RND transporter periplasmic adaptor subunit n=1 Tax=Ketobacter sp. TaxID=2083498 RepID=UPI000F2391A0|nr:efflux RND transporter periplasmic adaptor subunit [Ketobacter sp.]RLT96953.1 MAG: efflux RND transporter periplasmic adaptor subunit [Ketobacter sp.]